MTKTWCVGGKQYSNLIKISEYETRNPKTKEIVKDIKGVVVVFLVVINHEFLPSKWLEEKKLLKMQIISTGINQRWIIQHGVI